MSNSYFQFKQFIIHQELCAMKVCTDSCLFGAIASHFLKNKNIQSILDIGTGTGLLSLMLAQKINAEIDAIDIDKSACLQANQNFNASIFKNQINLFETSIQNFQSTKKYDFIISNPPFFENHLKSELQNKNVAIHSEQLTLKELATYIKNLLTENGIFAVLLPFERTQYFIEKMNSLFLIEKIIVHQTHNHKAFRSILFFSKTKSVLYKKNIYIKNTNNSYTAEFINYLKDYYLYL